jgi:hypothetical protein
LGGAERRLSDPTLWKSIESFRFAIAGTGEALAGQGKAAMRKREATHGYALHGIGKE